ncbi:hypothetical protein BJ138DRAFT_1161239 [Hygrophoropsis aurantiaca]|uniref:Uncharacterized protein n=1 Tax=Hygrophoropsis aurantiaca TaxID=72124 RepID=A0ACB8A2Z6_9AGAM|nr:hypothetical protein BJ138DRAFT_1161239 [Hygrophoropsis aurantiaca]
MQTRLHPQARAFRRLQTLAVHSTRRKAAHIPTVLFEGPTTRNFATRSSGRTPKNASSHRTAIDSDALPPTSHPTVSANSGDKSSSSAQRDTSGRGGGSGSVFPITNSPVLDAALTTIIGLGMVFVGGIAYIAWYKKNVLDKIEQAFAAGYDPALELANHSEDNRVRNTKAGDDHGDDGDDGPWTEHLRRNEQDSIDNIIKGKTKGHYFFLLGPKGGGKSTLIFDAMRAIQAEGVAFLDAHPDLEVFRLRLGKALNYEFNEDSQTGLFQRRDPREGGPALDIERALNKLEKVALRCSRKTGRPFVLVFNNIQHFNNDAEGRNMLLQLQQRAEAWAAAGIVTVVFSADDFWPFLLMRKVASRMHVLSIRDLDGKQAHQALTHMRTSRKRSVPTPEIIEDAISLVGGRLSYLSKLSRADDVLESANNALRLEKAWLLSQVGLIPDCDDDVMDEQKWSSCSWLLLQEFVKIHLEQQRERKEMGAEGDWDPLTLPSIPFWRCRQIMTRPDYMEDLDRANIISIDVNLDVRPDSVLILHAAREVAEEEGFQELLDNVRARVDEIESLHRTRELTFKDVAAGDRIRLTVDKGGALLVDS